MCCDSWGGGSRIRRQQEQCNSNNISTFAMLAFRNSMPLCSLYSIYSLLTTPLSFLPDSTMVLQNVCLSNQFSFVMSAPIPSLLLQHVCLSLLIRITPTACLHLFSAHYSVVISASQLGDPAKCLPL
jgi:hypothetical protein